MKKILIHIAIATCLFFLFDRTLGIGLKYIYKQSNATSEYKISYTNETTEDPILFFGSSRCLHHYIPAIFEKTLNRPCFNTGVWGIKNIYYHYGVLGNVLSRYTPETIIFDIHPCDWLTTPFSGKERATSLAPYCGMSKPCDDMLKLSGSYWSCRLSMVYRYTGSLPNLLTGKFGSMDRSLKGWKPLDGVLDTMGIKAEEYSFPVDSERVQLFTRFIEDCQQRDIRLILVVSPMYVCSTLDVFKLPRDLAAKYHIPFLDHYRDTSFSGHAEYFYDFGHLNRQGAELFSKQLATELTEKELCH